MIDPNKFPDVDVIQTTVDEGRAKITILRGGWMKPNPKEYMDEAVRQFVGSNIYNQFVEIHLDVPQVRIIVEGINNINFIPINLFNETILNHNGSR